MDLFFNADALYLPTLYGDVIEGQGRLNQWVLTPAPYFVPDWPIYFAMHGALSTPYHAIAGFFAVQIALTFALVVFVYRKFLDSQGAWPLAAASVLLLSWLATIHVQPYNFLLSNAFHYGAFLLLLFSIVLLNAGLESDEGTAKKYAVALLLLVAASSLSDKLFIAQFSLPALFCLPFLYRHRVRARLVLFGASVSAGTLLGVALYRFVVPNRVSGSPGGFFENPMQNVGELWRIVKAFYAASPFVAAILVLFYIGMIWLVILGRRRKQAVDAIPAKLRFLVLFNLIAPAFVLAVAICRTQPISDRYLLPVFFLPIILGPLILYLFLRTSAAKNMAAVAAAIGAIVFLAQLVNFTFKDFSGIRQAYYPAEVECIDAALAKHGLKHGVANYWDAKKVRVLSKTKPTVAQMSVDLTPFEWITSKDFYRPSYEFALVTFDQRSGGVDEKRLLEINGQPEDFAQCGATKVFMYPQKKLRIETAPRGM
ncbi:hypothetical protein [Noviherbaspirillum sp.]|uniref:hypothetical protein n=1 Tax=Noviherbaspirillum sp. TaxID=1926288 RepID=UPI002FE0A842